MNELFKDLINMNELYKNSTEEEDSMEALMDDDSDEQKYGIDLAIDALRNAIQTGEEIFDLSNAVRYGRETTKDGLDKIEAHTQSLKNYTLGIIQKLEEEK